MEGSLYDVGKRYAEIIEIVWFTYLYATLIPIGVLFSTIGLVMFYWIDKFNLVRRSSLRVHISHRLLHPFLFMLDWSIVMLPAGGLIFDGLLR